MPNYIPLWILILCGVIIGFIPSKVKNKVMSIVLYPIFYPFFIIRDIYACCFYQCLGFGTKKAKDGGKDKEVPIFKVKTNVVFLGITFVSYIKAKKVKNA